MKSFLFSAILCCLAITQTSAQRFGASVTGGFNISQITGDISAGYHKLGWNGGLQAHINLQEKTEISVGIKYSERGSRNQPRFPEFKYVLNYIEVPVIFGYKDWAVSEGGVDYHKIKFRGGLSYGNLLKREVEFAIHEGVIDEFNNFDISMKLGATFYSSAKLKFGTMFTRSLFVIYDGCKPQNPNGQNCLLPYHWTFFVGYEL